MLHHAKVENSNASKYVSSNVPVAIESVKRHHRESGYIRSGLYQILGNVVSHPKRILMRSLLIAKLQVDEENAVAPIALIGQIVEELRIRRDQRIEIVHNHEIILNVFDLKLM